jgi:GNAT superfamily N-acetyltransferase
MENVIISFDTGNVDEAIYIIREAAKWLIDTKKPMWKLEDLTKEKLLKDNRVEDFIVLKVDNKIAGAMILKWEDSFFWSEVKQDESGFIHKLSVLRNYSGKGISKNLVDYAIEECKKRNVAFLRLDCDGERERLCNFYENLGFKQVKRKMIRLFDTTFYDIAFYEMKV